MDTNKLYKIILLFASWYKPACEFRKIFEDVKDYDNFCNLSFKTYDIEDDEIGEELKIQYNAYCVPTTILLDKDNNLIKKIIGKISEKDFVDIIEDTLINNNAKINKEK